MKRRWMVTVLAATLTLVVAATIVMACRRWTITNEATRAELLNGVALATGLHARAGGRVSLRLLPYPTVQLDDLSLRGMDGALSLDADALKGRLDLMGLLHGAFRIGATRFESPTVVVNLDRLRPFSDGLGKQPPATFGLLHTAGLTFHNGVLQLRSSDPRRATLLTDVSGTLEWRDAEAEARLNGTATWHGVPGEIAVDIDKPGDIAAGGQSLASVRVRSPMLDLGGEGSLMGGGDTRAVGKLIASTPDLPALLRMIGRPMPALSGLQQARIRGDATVTADLLALDGVSLSFDDLAFEGAVAVHRNGGRTSIAGTLATDHIDLGRFLGVLPPVFAGEGRWSQDPLRPAMIAADDVDLRVSMERATLGHLTLEDGSLSLQSGDGRTELSLGEVRAYDGLVKGRVVATRDGDGVDVRADATMSRLDLARLARDLPGRPNASGSLTGHVGIEGSGATAAAVMGQASGRGQFDLRSGEIGGGLIDRLLQPADPASTAGLPLTDGTGAFDNAIVTFAVDQGALTLGESWVAWPAARAILSGSASLPGQSVAFRARVTPEAEHGTEGDYRLTGPWGALRLEATPPRF